MWVPPCRWPCLLPDGGNREAYRENYPRLAHVSCSFWIRLLSMSLSCSLNYFQPLSGERALRYLITHPHSARCCQARPRSLLTSPACCNSKSESPERHLRSCHLSLVKPKAVLVLYHLQASGPTSELNSCWDRKGPLPTCEVWKAG